MLLRGRLIARGLYSSGSSHTMRLVSVASSTPTATGQIANRTARLTRDPVRVVVHSEDVRDCKKSRISLGSGMALKMAMQELKETTSLQRIDKPDTTSKVAVLRRGQDGWCTKTGRTISATNK